MASPMNTGSFAQLLTKDYEKVFFDEYDRWPEEWSQLAKIENHSTYSVKEGEMVGMGAMDDVNEGAPIPYDGFTQGNEKEITFTNYAKALAITENMYDDDLKGHMKKGMQELGKSAAYTNELEFWDILNTGFVATYRTGLDSAALFTATHALFDSASNCANMTTGAALSYTSLQGLLDTFDAVKNHKGIPIPYVPQVLWIPPGLKWKAEELLMSPLEPGTANNQINTVKSIADLKYKMVHYFTSTTAYFISAANHDLRYMRRKGLQMKGTDDFNTGNALMKSSMRFTVDFFDWRGIAGNAGV